MKKRTIFDTASYLDLQTRPPPKTEFGKSLRNTLNRMNKHSVSPEEDINMETEASGHEAKISLQKEKIIELIEESKKDIAESIKIELKPPKGFILFPEPKKDTTYELGDDNNE